MRRTILLMASAAALLTLLTFEACIRDEDDFDSQQCTNACTTITGRITTGNGTEPLAGVEITALWLDRGTIIGMTTRKKARTHTDNNGLYTLRFEVRADELTDGYFQCTLATGSDYLKVIGDDTPLFYLDGVRNDTTIVHDEYIPYAAHMTIAIAGSSAMVDGDALDISIAPVNGSTAVRGVWWTYSSFKNDQELDVAAGMPLAVTVTSYKNNTPSKTRYDTLTLKKNERFRYTATFE